MIRALLEAVQLPLLLLVALAARFTEKRFDVGIGPEPLINNVFHKRALACIGYSAETFVSDVYYITDEFDVRIDRWPIARYRYGWYHLRPLYLFAWCAFRYRALVFYFNGGPVAQGTVFLWKLEPMLYALARIRTIVLPYGSDVQDMARSPNLPFKHAMNLDYPTHGRIRTRIAAQIDLWSKFADYMVGGCEWVDYMYRWDKLVLAHFSIDLEQFKEARPVERVERFTAERPLRLLHAPNHRAIKGTKHFEKAVALLQAEGHPVELRIVQRLPNSEVRRLIGEADIVLDQLVVGWYAMFAIEAMASRRPVICHLRDDLVDLYSTSGLITGRGDIPIIEADAASIAAVLRRIVLDSTELDGLGNAGYEFVKEFHSLEVIGKMFKEALE